MATKRFCDICDELMQPKDDQPFSRMVEYGPRHVDSSGAKAFGFIMIVNENNHPLTDVCNGCKLRIVNEGEDELPKGQSPVATLQPVAADQPAGIGLFAIPPLPKSPPVTPIKVTDLPYQPSIRPETT